MCDRKALRSKHEPRGVSVQTIYDARFEFTRLLRMILPFCRKVAEHIFIDGNIARRRLLREHTDGFVERKQAVVFKDYGIL